MGKNTFILGSLGSFVRFNCKSILSLASEFSVPGTQFGTVTHVLVIKGIPKTVMNHAVNHFSMPKPVADSGSSKEVRGIRHILHAACNNQFRITNTNGLIGQHNSFQTRTAHFIDGHTFYRIWKSSKKSCLAGWGLANSR